MKKRRGNLRRKNRGLERRRGNLRRKNRRAIGLLIRTEVMQIYYVNITCESSKY